MVRPEEDEDVPNLQSTDNQYNKVMTRIHGIAVLVQKCDHLIDWEGTRVQWFQTTGRGELHKPASIIQRQCPTMNLDCGIHLPQCGPPSLTMHLPFPHPPCMATPSPPPFLPTIFIYIILHPSPVMMSSSNDIIIIGRIAASADAWAWSAWRHLDWINTSYTNIYNKWSMNCSAPSNLPSLLKLAMDKGVPEVLLWL